MVQPDEPISTYNDALSRLQQRLQFLYTSGQGRYWFDVQPNLTRTVADRSSRISENEIFNHLEERLIRSIRSKGEFAGIHVCPENTADVPDEPAARLVVLSPRYAHKRVDNGSAALTQAMQILENRGNSPRRYRNMLLFTVADEDAVQSFLDDEAVEGRLKGAPATSRFLSDHENARVASDDIDTLAGLERQWLEEVNNDGIQALITSMPGVARGLVTTGEVSENVARGLGARALELISSAVRLHATVTAASIGADPGAFEEELDLARTLKTGADLLNYVPGTSWEDFKDHPLDNFIPFALEQGIISIPDMALVMASLPAYVLARTGELGQARAENDARANARSRWWTPCWGPSLAAG